MLCTAMHSFGLQLAEMTADYSSSLLDVGIRILWKITNAQLEVPSKRERAVRWKKGCMMLHSKHILLVARGRPHHLQHVMSMDEVYLVHVPTKDLLFAL